MAFRKIRHLRAKKNELMSILDTNEVMIKIESMLSEVVELQRDYVAETCPGCVSPCCLKVHYLFCEKDILFLRLSGRKARWRRESLKKKGCWFLGPMGCILDSKSRPFICHRYICSDLEKEMIKDDPGLLIALKEKFRVIDEMRSQIWDEYLEKQREDGAGLGRKGGRII